MPTASQARIMMGSSGNPATWTANLQKRVCTTVTCFPIAKISPPKNDGYGNSSYCNNTSRFNSKFDSITASKNPFVIPARRQAQCQLLSRGNDSPRTASFYQELDINGHDGILSFDRKSRTFRWVISSASAHDMLVDEKMDAELSEHDYERDETPPCPSPSRLDRTYHYHHSSRPVSVELEDYSELDSKPFTRHHKASGSSSARVRPTRRRAYTAPPSQNRRPFLEAELGLELQSGKTSTHSVIRSNSAISTVNRKAARSTHRLSIGLDIPSVSFSSVCVSENMSNENFEPISKSESGVKTAIHQPEEPTDSSPISPGPDISTQTQAEKTENTPCVEVVQKT